MPVIWKFPLDLQEKQIISMPKGAKLLDVQMQFDVPCLWALCDELATKEDREFLMIGTGVPISTIEPIGEYVGTFQIIQGNYVFHVFNSRIFV